ncbi:MAG: hypothetical protein HPKKFMNG_00717 [Planctomycetes bacterium]|nr:hypothetical protein [Planctomycetota bacterium]
MHADFHGAHRKPQFGSDLRILGLLQIALDQHSLVALRKARNGTVEQFVTLALLNGLQGVQADDLDIVALRKAR